MPNIKGGGRISNLQTNKISNHQSIDELDKSDTFIKPNGMINKAVLFLVFDYAIKDNSKLSGSTNKIIKNDTLELFKIINNINIEEKYKRICLYYYKFLINDHIVKTI